MGEIKIHVLRTGEVRVSPYLPFGGDDCSIIKASGITVLLFADGGYATKSWRDMITSGITLDKKMQRQSLQWIREQSMSPDCIESLATHDTEVQPHVIEI